MSLFYLFITKFQYFVKLMDHDKFPDKRIKLSNSILWEHSQNWSIEFLWGYLPNISYQCLVWDPLKYKSIKSVLIKVWYQQNISNIKKTSFLRLSCHEIWRGSTTFIRRSRAKVQIHDYFIYSPATMKMYKECPFDKYSLSV